MEKICKRCGVGVRQMDKGKNRSGTQKCLCGKCKKSYTINPKLRAYPDVVRVQAKKLLASGMSSRRVGQLLGFNKANAYNWCKDEVKKSEHNVDNRYALEH